MAKLIKDKQSQFEKVAEEIGVLVTEKNEAYGDSTGKTAAYLELLFPDGIPVERYGDVGLLVRDFDKSVRIATDKDAFGEDPWKDKAGYAIRGAVMGDEAKEEA